MNEEGLCKLFLYINQYLTGIRKASLLSLNTFIVSYSKF